jgi:hypothetical protein
MAMELERAWSWSWNYWSQGAEAGAGVGPTRDPSKHPFFFLVCLFCLFFFALQEKTRRRR